ncbi:Endonuclease/exonuclease/phosphatase [Gracilaria domingensis]|nr:Endonuclease/exonuclease/phosphatase [Gracilaria domingensis]
MSQAPRRSARLCLRKGSSSADSVADEGLSKVTGRKRKKRDVEGKLEIGNANGTQGSTKESISPRSLKENEPKGKKPRRIGTESKRANSKTVKQKKSAEEVDSNVVDCEKAGSVVVLPKPVYPEDHCNRPYEIPPGVLRVVTWNVASFRTISKSGAFQSYLEKENPHVLCLQETKMSEQAMNGIPSIEGYDVHWNHSRAKKGYSGVAVFINDNINSLNLKVERVEEGMGDEVADAEGRVLSLYFNNRLAIINSYVPNSGGKLMRLDYRTTTFEPKMRDFLNRTAEDWNVLYCGDLNVAHEEIDIHDSKGNKKSAGHTPEERKEFGHLLESGTGWVDCWRNLYTDYPGYTYYSRRFGTRLKEAGKGWRLDYHLMDCKTFELGVLSDCFVRPDVEGSDHYPVILDYKVSSNSNEATT